MINANWPADLKDRQGEDTRNVIDPYKYWTVEAIKIDLQEKRTELVVLFENFAHDFNISTGIRNCNAFTVGQVWIGGRRSFDKRGAVGTHNYENINYAADSLDVIKAHKEQGYRIVVADNIEGAVALDSYEWSPRTLLVFGQESIGVSQDAIDAADDVVYIPQRGSVRSLNVGAASAVMLYDYTAKLYSA